MSMRAKGFTLLELIIVLAVFGVFSVMAYGGLNYVLKARQSIELQLDRSAEWQKAFQRVRNDLELAVPRAGRDGFGQPQAAFVFEQFGARIEFTRSGWRNPLSQPRASLERVVYRYDDRSRELLRETWRALDRAEQNEPVKLVVLSQIDDARWRFMDSNRQFQDRWPPQSAGVGSASNLLLPLAIELTLESKDYGEIVWLLRPGVEPIKALPADGNGSDGKCDSGKPPTPPAGGVATPPVADPDCA